MGLVRGYVQVMIPSSKYYKGMDIKSLSQYDKINENDEVEVIISYYDNTKNGTSAIKRTPRIKCSKYHIATILGAEINQHQIEMLYKAVNIQKFDSNGRQKKEYYCEMVTNFTINKNNWKQIEQQLLIREIPRRI